jgi:hypothetical protein
MNRMAADDPIAAVAALRDDAQKQTYAAMVPLIDPLTLHEHGAELRSGAVASCLDDLRSVLADLLQDAPGTRIGGVEGLCRFLASEGPIGSAAASVLGDEVRAVRSVLFNKTEHTNWSLTWHQDRTICVRHRAEVSGYGPWTVKAGMQHVAPPFDLLTRMVTLRVHLDDVPLTNAPLLIAPRSHKLGRVPVDGIEAAVVQCGSYACLAEAGDIWLYSTPILHASEAATIPARRRVLQIDFAAEELPHGLEWLGV